MMVLEVLGWTALVIAGVGLAVWIGDAVRAVYRAIEAEKAKEPPPYGRFLEDGSSPVA